MGLWALIPEFVIGGLCIALLPVAGSAQDRRRMLAGAVAAAGLLAAIPFTVLLLVQRPPAVLANAYAIDGLASVFKLLIEVGALLTILLLLSYFRGQPQLAHAPVAILVITVGAMGLCSSLDLTLAVFFLLMIGLPAYVLAALVRRDPQALESSIHYLVFGAVALAAIAGALMLLLGISGSVDLRAAGQAFRGGAPLWVALALALILIGYGFEIAVVPFHPWARNVFSDATAPVNGFISVVPKIAAFAGLLRLLLYALPDGLAGWPWIVAGVAVLAMTIGNLAALRRQELGRLLSYWSIAQAGYVLIAVAVAGRAQAALPSIAYYLAAYLFMNLGAFAVAAHIERTFGSDGFKALEGIGRGAPAVAAVLAISLLSLAGIPPLSGFTGRVFLLKAAIEGGMPWLAIVAALNTALGIYCCLRVLARMYLRPPGRPYHMAGGFGFPAAYALALAGTLALSAWPAPIAEAANLAGNLVR